MTTTVMTIAIIMSATLIAIVMMGISTALYMMLMIKVALSLRFTLVMIALTIVSFARMSGIPFARLSGAVAGTLALRWCWAIKAKEQAAINDAANAIPSFIMNLPNTKEQ